MQIVEKVKSWICFYGSFVVGIIEGCQLYQDLQFDKGTLQAILVIVMVTVQKPTEYARSGYLSTIEYARKFLCSTVDTPASFRAQ